MSLGVAMKESKQQVRIQKANEGFEYLAVDPNFTELLSLYFARADMSYSQLAAAVHRDVAYVHRLLNGGQSRPSPNTIIRLALALKLSVSEADEILMAAGYAPLVRPRLLSSKQAGERNPGPDPEGGLLGCRPRRPGTR